MSDATEALDQISNRNDDDRWQELKAQAKTLNPGDTSRIEDVLMLDDAFECAER